MGAAELVAKTISNTLSQNGRFATVMPAQYAEQLMAKESLVIKAETWVTAADDLAGNI
jgi:flavodoxin